MNSALTFWLDPKIVYLKRPAALGGLCRLTPRPARHARISARTLSDQPRLARRQSRVLQPHEVKGAHPCRPPTQEFYARLRYLSADGLFNPGPGYVPGHRIRVTQENFTL